MKTIYIRYDNIITKSSKHNNLYIIQNISQPSFVCVCVAIATTIDDEYEYEYDKNHDRWMIDDKNSRQNKNAMMMRMTTNIAICIHLELLQEG